MAESRPQRTRERWRRGFANSRAPPGTADPGFTDFAVVGVHWERGRPARSWPLSRSSPRCLRQGCPNRRSEPRRPCLRRRHPAFAGEGPPRHLLDLETFAAPAGGDQQRGLGQAITGCSAAGWKPPGQGAGEGGEGAGAHRFAAEVGVAPAAQVERLALLGARAGHAEVESEIRPAAAGRPQEADRFEPAQRPQQEGGRRHQPGRAAAEDRVEHTRHQPPGRGPSAARRATRRRRRSAGRRRSGRGCKAGGGGRPPRRAAGRSSRRCIAAAPPARDRREPAARRRSSASSSMATTSIGRSPLPAPIAAASSTAAARKRPQVRIAARPASRPDRLEPPQPAAEPRRARDRRRHRHPARAGSPKGLPPAQARRDSVAPARLARPTSSKVAVASSAACRPSGLVAGSGARPLAIVEVTVGHSSGSGRLLLRGFRPATGLRPVSWRAAPPSVSVQAAWSPTSDSLLAEVEDYSRHPLLVGVEILHPPAREGHWAVLKRRLS